MLSVGRSRESGLARGRSSFMEELSRDRGGERSLVRMGLSFCLRLSPWRSAGDWKLNLLW